MAYHGEIITRMKELPVHRGYPVPWFVSWMDGKPEFRVADSDKFERALAEKRCWICGNLLDEVATFVAMAPALVFGVVVEPPCHDDCAHFAAKVCPYLALPKAKRRGSGLAEEQNLAAIDNSNPGVVMLWSTADWWPQEPTLIHLGYPTKVEWFREGRAATRDEVNEAIDKGLPNLMRIFPEEQITQCRELSKRWLPIEEIR
jgi:hypothetical protein